MLSRFRPPTWSVIWKNPTRSPARAKVCVVPWYKYVLDSDSTRWFGYKLCGTIRHLAEYALHLAEYALMKLVPICMFWMGAGTKTWIVWQGGVTFHCFFFWSHHFFVWNRVVWEWSNDKTIQSHTMLRLAWYSVGTKVTVQSWFTHSLYIDLWWRCPSGLPPKS